VFAVPDSIDDKTAAQFFINPCTAYGMLHEAQVPKGEYLLQTAANSVLGKQIISLAEHYGIKTINVVRRKDAVDEVKQAGGTEVINLESEDLVKRVQEITGGKGVHAALDPIGAKLTTSIIAAMGDGGKYQIYGALQPGPLEVDRMELMMKGKWVGGFVIYRWIERPDKEKVVQEVFDLLEKKVIKVDLGKSYPLEQFKEAIKEADKSGRRDKKFLEG
jgi:NADPH:quinone reductase-like Zn-dependent oxidoreductase